MSIIVKINGDPRYTDTCVSILQYLGPSEWCCSFQRVFSVIKLTRSRKHWSRKNRRSVTMSTALLCNTINFNNSISSYIYYEIRRLWKNLLLVIKKFGKRVYYIRYCYETFTNRINHCRLLSKFSIFRLPFAANIANIPQFNSLIFVFLIVR